MKQDWRSLISGTATQSEFISIEHLAPSRSPRVETVFKMNCIHLEHGDAGQGSGKIWHRDVPISGKSALAPRLHGGYRGS